MRVVSPFLKPVLLFFFILFTCLVLSRLAVIFVVDRISKDGFTFVQQVTQIEDKISSFGDQTILLSALPTIRHFATLEKTNQDEFRIYRDVVKKTFLELAFQDPLVHQLRYFNSDGEEIIRITREKTGITVDEEIRAVNASQRSYFSEALKLPPGSVYISELEGKAAETVPITEIIPVLRFSAPVYVPDLHKNVGVVTVSLYGNELFRSLNTYFGGEVLVFDEKGSYLFHSDPTMLFGRQLGTNVSHFTLYPEEQSKVQSLGDDFSIIRTWTTYKLSKKIDITPTEETRYWVIQTGSRKYWDF